MGKDHWPIRLSSKDLEIWMKEQNPRKLLFDGAFKGIPGRSRVGGVILDPLGNKIIYFSWGLRISTNNYAEIYGIWKGIQFLKIFALRKFL